MLSAQEVRTYLQRAYQAAMADVAPNERVPFDVWLSTHEMKKGGRAKKSPSIPKMRMALMRGLNEAIGSKEVVPLQEEGVMMPNGQPLAMPKPQPALLSPPAQQPPDKDGNNILAATPQGRALTTMRRGGPVDRMRLALMGKR